MKPMLCFCKRQDLARLAISALSILILTLSSNLISLPSVYAQSTSAWPNRPIRLIVPYAAGGFADTRARKMGDKLSKALGQPVVIENKAGAGGVTGTADIAKATDGYTFGFGSPAPLVTNAFLMKKLPYDSQRDLKAVVLLEVAPLILVGSQSLPAKSLRELVAVAKDKPGSITFGSSGVGGAHHLSGEMLRLATGTNLVHVPYKGGSPAASDLMAGHLSFMFEMGYSALPAIQSQKVRPLAVSGKKRLSILPDVPTVQEAGVPDFESYNWLGIIAPANTPPDVMARLNREFNALLKDPEVRGMIEGSGGEVVGGTPEAFTKFLNDERKRWGDVIRTGNIQIE